MSHHTIDKRQSGFALIEVLVTAVIVAIGVSGLGVLLMRAIQGNQDSAQQSQAIWMVQDVVGRIRANSTGARGYGYVISGQTDCNQAPTYCADHYKVNTDGSGGTTVAASICTPTQMAAYDVWITVCGINSGVYDSPSDFMIDPRITAQCTFQGRSRITPGTQDCVQYTINLNWSTRLRQGSADADERIHRNNYSTVVEVN